jgi:hypothetical protein
VVHLVDISVTDEQQKLDSGVVHHVVSRDFSGMKRRLQCTGIPFNVRQAPGGNLRQIFVTPQWRDDRTQR